MAESAQKIAWNLWNPGLDNQDKTLGEVLETLPGADPKDISLLVRLLENPKSPLAFTGAVTLMRHDCIHIILGRGLLPQDEAFVIGFTMGTAKEDLSPVETFIFRKIARYLYPTNYRLSDKNLVAYNLGLKVGRQCKTFKIFQHPIEEWRDRKLQAIRKILGIDVEELKAVYRREKELLPETKASKRLPV